MYSTLERIDLGSVSDEPSGAMRYLTQTDHRDAETITAEAPLSVIFAITRCLLAHELARQQAMRPYRVVYASVAGEPPAFLRYVVAAAGASVVPGKADPGELPELVPRHRELPSLIADACARLAAETWKRSDFEPSVAGLAAYEHLVRYATYDNGETEHYEAIVTLGALCASLLIERGLQWQLGSTIVPFVLGSADGTAYDVFGAARDYLNGEPRRPSDLAGRARGEPLLDEGPFAAYSRRTGMRIGADEIAVRVLAGRRDDVAGRAIAEELAREVVDALRRWGEVVGDQVTWVERPIIDIDLGIGNTGKSVLDLLDTADRGDDGVYALFDALRPIAEAIDKVAGARGFSGRALQEDAYRDCVFRSAVRRQLRVPATARRFAGVRFADTPNPFAPRASLLATGYAAEFDANGITLIVPLP